DVLDQKSIKPAESASPTWRWFALSLVFFLLATLSKPSVVMLPVVLALCIWWQKGRICRSNFAALAPFVLISAVVSPLDNFRAKVSSRRNWRGVGPDLAGTFNHRRPSDMVLSG